MTCPDCNGTGTIVLFTSVQVCTCAQDYVRVEGGVVDGGFVPSFLMSNFVTVREYREFVSAYQCGEVKPWQGFDKIFEGNSLDGKDDFPAHSMRVGDMNAYAEWKGARLPTIQQWKLADQADTHPHNEIPERSGPIKSARPNAKGLYDMRGLLWTTAFSAVGEAFGIGGSWNKLPEEVLATDAMLIRLSGASHRGDLLGFRLVKEIT